jgi:hypothetical protein
MIAISRVLACSIVLGTAAACVSAGPAQASTSEQVVDGVRVSGLPRIADRAALDDYLRTNATTTTVAVATGDLVSASTAPDTAQLY